LSDGFMVARHPKGRPQWVANDLSRHARLAEPQKQRPAPDGSQLRFIATHKFPYTPETRAVLGLRPTLHKTVIIS
jgi:hypothetical protein